MRALSFLKINNDSRRFENFLGAAIQELNEWSELEDYQFTWLVSLVGNGLRLVGRYADALPLLTKVLRDTEHSSSHNDLANTRIQLAWCYLMLNQIENTVDQLRTMFGPEYGRLAILAPGQSCCREHGGDTFRIEPKLMEVQDISFWPIPENLTSDEPANIEIPAGTFCLEDEIIPSPVIDETTTLYSTVFFSSVKLRSVEVINLHIASEIIRELHWRSATTYKGFTIRKELEEC
jgi:hypothetical protein